MAGKGAEGAGQALASGWPGVRMGSSRGGGRSQRRVTGLGGCPGRGQGAELAPGCPTPGEGSGTPHPPSAASHPGVEDPIPAGSRDPGTSLRDADTNPSRTGLRPRARGLPAPKHRGRPRSCCQPGPCAGIGVCGKRRGPGEWDGLWRDPCPHPGAPRPLGCLPVLPPYSSLPALDGVIYEPPTSAMGGAAGTGQAMGTCAGDTEGCGDTARGSGGWHWGRGDTQQGHRGTHRGQGDTRAVGTHKGGSPGMCTGVVGMCTPRCPLGTPAPARHCTL